MSPPLQVRSFGFLCLMTFLAGPAWAWKVTTHQSVAVKAARDLPDGDLKTVLLGNERYLRAGSMGPDIFYLPPFMAQNVYSDLAHYCLTDQLAQNMVFFAGGRGPQAKAFAWGWFAHNVGDSVAHPWVNGFTGQPYRDLRLSGRGAIDEAFNLTHVGIEGWVDKRLFAEGFSDRVARGIEVKAEYEAFLPFWLDENIQQLVVDAYRLTYLNERCDRRPFTPPTKELVSDAGRNFAVMLGALGVGDFVLDLVDLEVLDLELKKLALQRQEDVRLIRATWKDYVSRSVQYTTKAWQAPSRLSVLNDLNLDQGINPQRRDLEVAWQKVKDLEGLDIGVFTTPGDNYVAGGERPPPEDRCQQTKDDGKA
jgi:hypothetical protein